MKEVSVTHVVVCPFCHKTGEVTITADRSGPRLVEMEYICEHLAPEYDENMWGIYVHFTNGEGGDDAFIYAPLALYIWEGDPHLIARALRRRGFKVRVDGRHIIFEAPADPREVDHALRRYMLVASRTISYQYVRL